MTNTLSSAYQASARVLLEAAAQAAGIEIQWDECTGGAIRASDDGADVTSWNPLVDKVDARGLAEALGLSVKQSMDQGGNLAHVSFRDRWGTTQFAIEWHDRAGGEDAATCRAIVRAAAQCLKEVAHG